MDIAVIPIAPEHIESFHRALDIVARERKYLTLLEAPPLEQTWQFVLDNTENSDLQFVALAEDEVVGWCDVRRHVFPAHAHRGTLGMGIVPAWRGRGLGLRLVKAILEQAR
jgi:GNAT superfamily N-acetyltransferase